MLPTHTLMYVLLSALMLQKILAAWEYALDCNCKEQNDCECCVDFTKLTDKFNNTACIAGGDGKSVKILMNNEIVFDTLKPKAKQYCLDFEIGAVLCIGVEAVQLLPAENEIKICTKFEFKLVRTSLRQIPTKCIRLGVNFAKQIHLLEYEFGVFAAEGKKYLANSI